MFFPWFLTDVWTFIHDSDIVQEINLIIIYSSLKICVLYFTELWLQERARIWCKLWLIPHFSHWWGTAHCLKLLGYIIFQAQMPNITKFLLLVVRIFPLYLISLILNWIYLHFWTAGLTKQTYGVFDDLKRFSKHPLYLYINLLL